MSPLDGAASIVFDLGVRGTTAAWNLSRTAKQGPFTERELGIAHALHPHLMRAFWLSVKLAEKARLGDGVLEGLERSAFAVILLDAEGRIAHANKTADAMLRNRDGLRCKDRMLSALRSDSAAALQKLISDAVTPGANGRIGGSRTIARTLKLPLTVTVTPLRSERHALFEPQPAAIVCVFDPTSPLSFSVLHLHEMFGLSAAESRMALKLLDGLDQKEIAAALGISFFTARAHLSQVYQKTQTNRQAEFVSLVMRTINPELFRTIQ